MKRGFAERYADIKKGLQELAELDLVKAIQDYSAVTEAYQFTLAKRRAAQQARPTSATGADWQAWTQYVAALETLEARQQEACAAAEEHVAQRRQDVSKAMQEVKRWDTVADKQRLVYLKEVQHREQQAADEGAVLRFGKGTE